MGSTLRKLVQDIIPHKLLPITSIFQELCYTGNEPKINKDSIEIGVHLALMFLTSIGNILYFGSDIELQTARFNALAGNANLSTFNPDWQIPSHIIIALFHILKSYPAFVAAFVKQFLIPDIKTLSTFENALKVQVKPILFEVGKSDFQFYYNFIREIINSPLIEIKEIQEEMDKPFHEACVFFQKQSDVEKPFTKLLNLSSPSVLDSKNFPFISYAVKCIIAVDIGKGLTTSLLDKNMPVHQEIRVAVYSRRDSFLLSLNLDRAMDFDF